MTNLRQCQGNAPNAGIEDVEGPPVHRYSFAATYSNLNSGRQSSTSSSVAPEVDASALSITPNRRRDKRPASPVPLPSVDKGTGPRAKKRLVKQQPSRSKADMAPAEQRLVGLIESEGTGVYHRHISCIDEATANAALLRRLYQRSPELCTTPATDNTFPTTRDDCLAYVAQLYAAIWDWRDYLEMDKGLEGDGKNDTKRKLATAKNMETLFRAQQLPEGDPARAALLASLPSVAMQQKKVLCRIPANYLVEHLCWQLLSYAEQAQRGVALVDFWSGTDGA